MTVPTEDNIADEREGCPSASVVERLAACPGSLRQSRGAPEFSSPEMREWADSGERIHLWLESPDFCPLDDPDELDVAERCAEQRDALVQQVFGGDQPVVIKEKRLWLRYTDGRKRFSGRLDFDAEHESTALVVDYKTSRGDQPPATSNLQLRAHAVLRWLDTRKELSTIWVAIVQPLLGKPIIVPYDIEALVASYDELNRILESAEHEDAPLRAGKHCKFCPARLNCPAARKLLEQLAEIDTDQLDKIPGDKLAELLDLCKACEPIIKDAREFAKQKLTVDPLSVPGWALKDTGANREVNDSIQVFDALEAAGLMDYKTFIAKCVSVGIRDLEKTVGTRNNLKKKAAERAVFNHCKDFIVKKPKKPTLERIE